MIDPNTAIGAAGEGAKGLGKLAQLTEKIMGPIITRHQAEADKYAADIKMQQIRDNPDMLISFENGSTNIKAKSDIELFERAEQRRRIVEIRQEQNIEQIIEITARQLNGERNVSEDPVDEDWMARYFSIIKDISVEEMQLLWAKILSEEIKRPGAFSLRTLEIVRNLSKKEANTFQKIVPLILLGQNMGEIEGFLISEKRILEEHDVTFTDIKLLDECGLIISNGAVTYSLNIKKDSSVMVLNKGYLIIANTRDASLEQKLGVYPLTQAGKELYETIVSEPDFNFVKSVAEIIHKKNVDQIQTNVHKVVLLSGKDVTYENEPLFTAKRILNEDD